jgi:site-specific DNA-methyltransferase (adenine-specific)
LVKAVEPGGLILDPFAGSGTTLYVAEKEGRNSIGIEMEQVYCDVIRGRMAG